MPRLLPRRTSGFTLVELAIVLGVAGLLFGGLWRLMSTGNLQMRDQAAATQMAQLETSIATFLQSDSGQALMQAAAANAKISILLPSTQAHAAGNSSCSSDANVASYTNLCSILPPGFWAGTTNPYGQTYQINVLKDSSIAGVKPQTYSFMVLTTGGDTIPDTSGGRISSMVGGDGGFVYSVDTCTSGNTYLQYACGAFGSWNAAVSTYFTFTNAAAGHIAARSYYAPTQNVSDYWLARKFINGDTATSPVYNTMTTPFFLGGQTLYLGSTSGVETGGGAIDLQNGLISGTRSTSNTSSMLSLSGETDPTQTSLMYLNGSCSSTTDYTGASCGFALSVAKGDVSIGGLLVVNSLYSQTFMYYSSDLRLKKDIKPLADTLNDMMKLKPVSFAYKSNDMKAMGVIAQDLEKVYPDLVTTGRNGMKAVNYEGLIAPLVSSVQELKTANDDLRAQLKAQTDRQDKLEKEIEALRAK